MFLIANFNQIGNPTFSEKIKYYFKGEQITITQEQSYKFADIYYVHEPNLRRIIPKLLKVSQNILADKSISLENVKKYGLYEPSEFLNNVAVNSVCYAVLRSVLPINKRNVTFVDMDGKYLALARILVEHFFCVNIITENKEVYEEFKISMMNELGAIVIIKAGKDESDCIYISTRDEDRGSFRIAGKHFRCIDTKIKGINISPNINRIAFASAMTEICGYKDYLNIVSDTVYDVAKGENVPIENVVRLIDARLI